MGPSPVCRLSGRLSLVKVPFQGQQPGSLPHLTLGPVSGTTRVRLPVRTGAPALPCPLSGNEPRVLSLPSIPFPGGGGWAQEPWIWLGDRSVAMWTPVGVVVMGTAGTAIGRADPA